MNMNPTRDQLFDVIELMMNRLDSLEIEQKKQKEFSVQIKKRDLELNNFINDIMDVIENMEYVEDNTLQDKVTKYASLRTKVLDSIDKKELDESEYDLLDHSVGES